MKTTRIAILSATLCLPSLLVSGAPAFDSGSNGSMGAFNPTTSTNLQVPPDGVFHFTTVNIPNGVGVTFTRNALNTPVYLLAQGNLVIVGVIDLYGGNSILSNPGRGGPGGFDGGFGTVQGLPASDGQGPGGGKTSNGKSGAFGGAASGNSNTNIYGNTVLVPLIGGSGGAGGTDGNGGDATHSPG
jgi:hypothetical protein